MNRRRLYTLFSLLTTLSLLVGLSLSYSAPVLAQDTQPPAPHMISEPGLVAPEPETPWLWTRWNATQYALAEDDHSLWIGGAGSILRWDKTSRTYRRYGSPEGIPHRNIYAIAVDEDGNRWFGGDRGLSRLDADEQWHHYTAQNSDLHSNLVTGIAVGADGTLWLDHGAPDGVSRRLADDSWQWFPNLAALIEADSERILQTQKANLLWAVSGNEIWLGYFAYKDGRWINRTPEGAPPEVQTVVAGRAGRVWVLPEPSPIADVYMWNGEKWMLESKSHLIYGGFTAIAADKDGSMWAGWVAGPEPYNHETIGYGRLGSSQKWPNVHSYVSAMLASAEGEGVWAIGSSWLIEPDGTVNPLPDRPRYATVTNAVLGGDGLLRLHSQYPEHLTSYVDGNVETLADQGDPALDNDQWTLDFYASSLTAIERTPKGDLWLAVKDVGVKTVFSPPPVRNYRGTWIPASGGRIAVAYLDIFAQDEHHTWFADPGGVVSLDDGGTIDDLSDDVWHDYPIETTGSGGAVAVDALGRLWFGDSSGLYLYQQDAWQPFRLGSNRLGAICDLTPAPNGVLFVQVGSSYAGCNYGNAVYTLQPDGKSDYWGVGWLVREQYELVRSTVHRNRLWTVAPDGAVWYISDGYLLDDGYVDSPTLFRHDVNGPTRFQLPFAVNSVASLEVDANNHVWLVADGSLWRLSPPPSFELSMLPVAGMLEIGAQQSIQVQVAGRGGFTGTVSLAVAGLPQGITATLDRSEVPAGEYVSIELTSAPSVSPGTYTFRVDGTSGTLTDSLLLTMQVVADLFERYLPAISR